MGELNAGPRHPLSGTDTESHFDLHVVPPLSICYVEGCHGNSVDSMADKASLSL